MMKAPDKIYIAESLIKTPYGNEWSPTPYISRENTEYIRKDALLEWAKEKNQGIVMSEKELIQFLKENLTINVYHPDHNVGYYDIRMEPDEHNITVEIKLCGKLICKDTSY